MRKIPITSILILTVIFLTGCSSDDGINHVYYQFDEDDMELILKYDYRIGEMITYKNQNGGELNFRVVQNETSKQGAYSNGTFSGGGGFLESYYDNKIVRFEIVENQDYEDNGLVNYIFSKSKNSFKVGINFPLWNVANFSFIDELQNDANIPIMGFDDLEKTPMVINNHVFEQVITMKTDSEEIHQDSSYGTLELKMNRIHYDIDFGIVQFDDIEGNEWKLVYPE